MTIVLSFPKRINAQDIGYNKDLQINTFVTDYIIQPSMDVLKNGNFIVCWHQANDWPDESISDVFATIIDDKGYVVVNEFQVNSFEKDSQGDPYLSVLSDGKVVVVWASKVEGDNSFEISAQFLSESGQLIGNEFRVNTFSPSAQWKPCVASISNDRFVVVWESWDQDGSEVGIYAQIFDNNGVKIGNEFHVSIPTEGWQCEPTVIGLSTGEFLINYKSDSPNEVGWYDDFIQIFDNNGVRNGDEIYIGEFPDFISSRKTDIYELKNNQIAVSRITEDKLIYLAYNKDGSITVDKEIELEDRRYASTSIGVLNENRIILFWTSYSNSFSDHRIDALIQDYSGNPIGTIFQLTDKDVSVETPIAKPISSDKFIVIYTGRENDKGIYGKYYLMNPINHDLTEFDLLNPVYDETIYNFKIQFIWNKATNIRLNFPWELNYDLYVSENFEFTNPEIFPGIPDTNYLIDSLPTGRTYFWKVLARNIENDTLWSSGINGFYIDENATDIKEEENSLPYKFELFQNYPNPFNPSTTIKYSLNTDMRYEYQDVRLVVYNILGMEIAVLVNENQTPGKYQVEFNSADLPSGIYFYRLQIDNYSETKKMIIIK